MPVNPIVAWACILNSALYTSGVFTAGLVTGNRWAWALSLVTVGICYLAYFIQGVMPAYQRTAIALVMASIVTGVLAGLSLVI